MADRLTRKQSDVLLYLLDLDERPMPEGRTVLEISEVAEDVARSMQAEGDHVGYVGWEREGILQTLLRMRQRDLVEQIDGEKPHRWRITPRGERALFPEMVAGG